MTKFKQNPLGGYGYIFVLLFTVGINQNICDFGHIVFLLSKNTVKTDRKKYNMAKVANILVHSHCKKKKKRFINNRPVDFAETWLK